MSGMSERFTCRNIMSGVKRAVSKPEIKRACKEGRGFTPLA
jgi:hypothetical protein